MEVLGDGRRVLRDDGWPKGIRKGPPLLPGGERLSDTSVGMCLTFFFSCLRSIDDRRYAVENKKRKKRGIEQRKYLLYFRLSVLGGTQRFRDRSPACPIFPACSLQRRPHPFEVSTDGASQTPKCGFVFVDISVTVSLLNVHSSVQAAQPTATYEPSSC